MVSKLLYPGPSPNPSTSSFPAVELSESLQRVYNFGTATAIAWRIPLMFESPARVMVHVESTIGNQRGWLRAGMLVQCLFGPLGHPKKEVERLYLDEKFIELDGIGYPYFLEFWPYRWLKDYYLEIWAQLPQTIVVINNGEAFTIAGEPYTINGIAYLI